MLKQGYDAWQGPIIHAKNTRTKVVPKRFAPVGCHINIRIKDGEWNLYIADVSFYAEICAEDIGRS